MRHHNANRKFGRVAGQRRALLRSLAASLVRDGKMTTTEARAKELRPFVERMVTTARKGTLASRRIVLARLGGEVDSARRLASDYGPRYKERQGGYTRITKLPSRVGDRARMAQIEFV
jgi:large subunit ribosomal protein L17